MHRWVKALAIAATLLSGTGITAGSAQAASIEPSSNGVPTAHSQSTSGWVSVPVPPFERAAGVVCDFAVKGVPIVADLKKRTLQTNPDGTVRSELWVGPLIYEVTNESTGTQAQLDGSSEGVIVYHADGSSTWYLHGPLGLAVPAGGGNLPRGLYQVDGKSYTLTVSATGYRTLDLRRGTVENICPRLA